MNKEEKHLEINKKKWDKWSVTLDGKGYRNEFLRKAQKSVISLLDFKEGMNILDIGCGTGYALRRAAELNNYNGLFYGVDLSSKMIEKAEDNFKDHNNFHFVQSNAESIPLDDNFFDIIICTNSFHHYLNPGKALKEMHRLLKSGGKLYILDPAADNLFLKFFDKVAGLLEPSHVKIYSTKEFKELFSAAGLSYYKTVAIKSQQKIHIGEKESKI